MTRKTFTFYRKFVNIVFKLFKLKELQIHLLKTHKSSHNWNINTQMQMKTIDRFANTVAWYLMWHCLWEQSDTLHQQKSEEQLEIKWLLDKRVATHLRIISETKYVSLF